MNEYEEFLNGIAVIAAAFFVLGMGARVVRTAYRDRRHVPATATGGTAVPLLPPDAGVRSYLPVGAPPEALNRCRLLITGCTDPHMWYAKMVGREVPYLGTWPEGHKSREPDGFINIVKFHDARVVIKEEEAK